MPFEKGESGNPGGRARNSFTLNALLMEMRERDKNGDAKGMRKVAAKVWELAEAGEQWAVTFIRDTLDGKPAQQVIHAGDEEGGPIAANVTHNGQVALSGSAAFIAEALGAGAAAASEEPGEG